MHDTLQPIVTRLNDLVLETITEIAKLRSLAHLVTKQDLTKAIQQVMSAIETHATKQREFNQRLAAAFEDLTSDLMELKSKIDQLQNNPGPISPSDQLILDELQAEAQSFVERFEALASSTPPPVVTEPTPVPPPSPV